MNNTYISIHVFVHMQSYGEKEGEEGGIVDEERGREFTNFHVFYSIWIYNQISINFCLLSKVAEKTEKEMNI